MVLSCTQDAFFKDHRYDNFGDLGEAIKVLLDDYQKKTKMNENISSVEDMQAFMERYPAFRSQSLNVSKHVAVVSSMSKLTDKCQLLPVSHSEQEISCGNDHGGHKRDLIEKIQSASFQNADKLRLAMLFLIRYESYGEIAEIKRMLENQGLNRTELSMIDAILNYAGEAKRTPNLFNQGGLMATIGKHLTMGIQGVENVYTQHQPLITHLLGKCSLTMKSL